MTRLQQIGVQIPCMPGAQGDKILTYSANVQAAEITTLLGHDPRSSNWKHLAPTLADIYKRNQRVTQPDRQRKLEFYIRSRMGQRGLHVGAFPAISIGFQFDQPFEDGSLLLTSHGVRLVIDGLGRITGCLNIIDQRKPEDEMLIKSLYLPVTFFMPPEGGQLSIEDLGQLFSDFNGLGQKVSAKMAVSLDQTNLYARAARELLHEEFIASVERKGLEAILHRAVRCGTEGPTRIKQALTTSLTKAYLTEESYRSEVTALIGFFQELASRMGERWSDTSLLHQTSVGWQAIAAIHFRTRHPSVLNIAERSVVLDLLASLDWSITNDSWSEIVQEKKDGLHFNLNNDAAIFLVEALHTYCFQRRLQDEVA